MNVRKFFSKHVKTIIVAIAIATIGFLINWVVLVADEATIESAYDEMEQIGVQHQILLTTMLGEAENELLLFAKSIVQNNVDSDNIVEYFNTQSQVERFDNLYYIELDGRGTSVDGACYNFSENESFIHSLNNNFYIEKPHVSSITSEIVFDLAVPVIKNNKPIAVLFCEVSAKDFLDTIMEQKTYEGDIFFIDNDLNIIFSTNNNYVGIDTISESDMEVIGAENLAQAQRNLANKQNGGFYYDYFGIPKIMVYYPIESTNVALAMNVTVESLSGEIIKASKNFEIAGSVIYWTGIILVIYISVVQIRAKKDMMKLAYYDQLTELPNLARLKLEMKEILLKNPDKEYTIHVFDIENFKAINEMFGYEMGDRVLKAFKSISDKLNEPSLIMARIGDDKFAMFFEGIAFEDLGALIENMIKLYDTIVPELKDYAGTFKLGRYKIEKGECNVDEIISKVNLAHNKAKAVNGEAFCDYDETFKKVLQKEAEITNKMYGALENKEFKVFLQPKFSINENKLIGAEALVRWIEADNNMIFPNDFIPLFERNGFIVELDKYIFDEVCQVIKGWMDAGLGAITIAVNCSRFNLKNLNFVSTVVEIVDKYNIPHEFIEIELTESATIESQLTIEQMFEDLHKQGFKVSIDDFGAGQSSLGMLKNLNIDTLKMDRSFFVNRKNARRDDMLIDSIIKMSHNLGMYVVAEGIETAEQVELLKSMNCDAVQGYFYDKPMSISDFEKKYHREIHENLDKKSTCIPVINHINDVRYASSVVPCGIVVAKVDEYFTLVEANDYYFEMIGYTREEVRDEFNNYGINIMTPESRIEILKYFQKQMQIAPEGLMEFTNKFTLKSGKVHTFRLNGKIAINASGEANLYASVIDITDYSL